MMVIKATEVGLLYLIGEPLYMNLQVILSWVYMSIDLLTFLKQSSRPT
jgi:hypothetical protein